MSLDKQNTGHIAKPLTPTISAAFSRANKTPLTPKLANPPHLRTPKRLAPSEHPASTPRPGPEPPYLSANITPRSGSRNSRRDGSTLSPNNTSTNGQYSPQSTLSPAHGRNTPGVRRTDRSPVRTGGRLEPPRTARAKTLTADLNTISQPHSDFSSGSPMFFHASDIRSVSGASDADTRSRVSARSASPATFIYANGQEEPQAPLEESARRSSSGFSRPVVVAKPPTASARLKSPKINEPSLRLAESIHPQGGPHLDASPEICSQMHSPPLSTVSSRPPMKRHMKSSSLDTRSSGIPQQETSPKEGLRPSPIITSPSDSQLGSGTVASDPILRPRVFSNGSTVSVESQSSAPQSPVKSEQAGNSGFALSARVERKILDLEISNSSLLAINRTLEREMRKQHAELRRYRRLSRSGRLSVAPSSRSVSGTLSIPSEIDEAASELSSNPSQEDMSDFSDEESLPDDSTLDRDSVADGDTRQSIRHEKRVLTDLTKHQELLADSQKINQSLKRCLGWTEELIKEARKALEYNVHVNDVQLGGRVLSPDELNEVGEAGGGLLRPVAIPSPDAEFPILDNGDDDSLSL